MRSFRKALATVVTGAALAAATIVTVAAPASASPEDGNGCAGFPAIPQSYVCVISATPQNALPSTTTTSIPVTVPAFCYVAGCTAPTTVNVPVPGAQSGSGHIAVLWYQGVYYPVSIGTDALLPVVNGVVTLATGAAGSTVATVTNLAGTTIGTINGIAGVAVAEVQRIVAGLPTLSQVVAAVNSAVATASAIADGYVQAVLALYQNAVDTVTGHRTVQTVIAILNGEYDFCYAIYRVLDPLLEDEFYCSM